MVLINAGVRSSLSEGHLASSTPGRINTTIARPTWTRPNESSDSVVGVFREEVDNMRSIVDDADLDISE